MRESLKESIVEIKNQLISVLTSNQKASGEFETFAITREGTRFYIGESPFVTAQIVYLLHLVKDKRLEEIVQKSTGFLERTDYTGKRIYKYWYNNVQGTAFPILPFDLDDTSVVNQALALSKRKTVDVAVLLNNRNRNKLFYTWLKPSFKTLIRHPTFLVAFAEYFKTYPIFLKNSDNLFMAEYDDSEIIVRMNVYIMLAIMGKDTKVADGYFPFSSDEVKRELRSSLHYNNLSMYYFTLSKFQKHASFFNEEKVGELALHIRAWIKEHNSADYFADITASYLSLAFIEKFTINEAQDFLSFFKNESWKNASFKVCVGNKKFKDYHEYCSNDFTLSMAIRLLDEIEKLK